MKHIKLALLVVLSFLIMTTSFYAYAQPDNLTGKTIQELETQYGESIEFNTTSTPDIYIGIPYAASSLDGFKPYTDSEGNKYMLRIRHIKLDQIDYGSIVNTKHIISVPRGMTYSTTETNSISKTYSSSWSVGGSVGFQLFKDKLNAEVNTQYTSERSETTTYTISQGTSYTFPSGISHEYNIAHYYMGFIHDKYEVIADVVRYVTKEKLTRVISIEDDEEIRLVWVILADGREILMRKDQLDRKIRDGYYVEYENVYDYDNMESEYGTLLAPKPITFVLYGSI